MHWILTVPDSFLLSQVIQRSIWILYPPFSVDRAQEMLNRVERLNSGHSVVMTISQQSAGVLIHTNERLSGAETEEIINKTRRILRLGENLQPFLDVAQVTAELAPICRQGVRMLRGATLFEDVIKAVIMTHETPNSPRQNITWLVDELGDPLASNPTRHTFPTPHQVLKGQAQAENTLTPALGQQLGRIAKVFASQEQHIQTLTQVELPLGLLETSLQQTLHLNEAAMSLVMLSLGRYDYIPTDADAMQRVSQLYHDHTSISPEEVRHTFAPWQPWGGLAYWLWDWENNCPHPTPLEGELERGEFENQCRPS